MRVTFTAAGRAALINAAHTGTAAVIVTALGLTAQAFMPDPDGADTVLPGEHTRLSTLAGTAVAADVIHLTARDNSSASYAVRGIGLYLDDGTLLCLYGQDTLILEKSAQAVMLLAADLAVAELGTTQIQFGSTEFLNPPATTEVQGVVELATPAEALRGRDCRRAMTPATLQDVLNDRLGPNAPTDLAKSLIAAATEAVMHQLLGLGSAALKNEGSDQGLDADLLDGHHGDYYRDWRNLTHVPPSLHIPGQIIAFAAPKLPPGVLPCDGSAVSRTTYAALFAAIGTTHGAGDGSTTFNLPSIGTGCTLVHSAHGLQVGKSTRGEVIGHTHTATISSAGGHAHTASAGAAGAHAHTASTDHQGDHVHGAWTDAQGYHAHTGSTAWQGDHQHTTAFAEAGHIYPWGADYNHHMGSRGNVDFDNPWPYTSPAGGHAHSLSTDGAGHHGHGVGMNTAGGHGHNVSVASTGDHAHMISVQPDGEHSHDIHFATEGSYNNLPAGAYVHYCITF